MRRYLKYAAAGAAILLALALVALFLLSCGCAGTTTMVSARMSALRANDHTGLRAFLHAMPKGADLHVHLSGAVYVEDFIAWAVTEKLCVQADGYKMVPQNDKQECGDKTRPVSEALTDQSFYDGIVNAQSMRNYIPSAAEPSGHDQFFATFGKYGEVSWRVPGQMTALLLRRYAAEHVQHTELMITLTPQTPKLDDDLLRKIAAATEPAAKLALLKDYIEQALPEAKKNLDNWEDATKAQLSCSPRNEEPACKVSYRYIAQVNRNSDAAKVFANTAFAAALVRADKRVAGLNFVGPEDYRIARTDYREHMKAIGYLTRQGGLPEVPVALHAGELWIGLVRPDDLTFHIREAVETAGAKRIGHGVALAFEPDHDRLLAHMSRNRVAVEINLTSNDVILGVRGKDHPLTAYRAASVPVVLSTDDAGVSRIDLTNEYFRAARDYPIGYRALRRMARNSIEHAFLDREAKKKALEAFDAASVKFERTVAAQGPMFSNMGALLAAPFR